MRYVDAVVNLKQPENTGGASFSGCHRVIWQTRKLKRVIFTNSQLKKAEKTNYSRNLDPMKSALLFSFFFEHPVYTQNYYQLTHHSNMAMVHLHPYKTLLNDLGQTARLSLRNPPALD